MQRFGKWHITLSEELHLHKGDRTSTGENKQQTLPSMNALEVNSGK